MKKNIKKIIYSGMLTPDGTLLESLYTHDYQCHDDKNGKHYILDGGNSYIRSSLNGDERFITLYNTDPWEIVRKFKKRLNHRRNQWVVIENIDDEWLDNILEWDMKESSLLKTKFINEDGLDKAFLLYLREKQFRNVETEIF